MRLFYARRKNLKSISIRNFQANIEGAFGQHLAADGRWRGDGEETEQKSIKNIMYKKWDITLFIRGLTI